MLSSLLCIDYNSILLMLAVCFVVHQTKTWSHTDTSKEKIPFENRTIFWKENHSLSMKKFFSAIFQIWPRQLHNFCKKHIQPKCFSVHVDSNFDSPSAHFFLRVRKIFAQKYEKKSYFFQNKLIFPYGNSIVSRNTNFCISLHLQSSEPPSLYPQAPMCFLKRSAILL